MKANIPIESFVLRGTAIHCAPDGDASLLRGEGLKARLQKLPGGLLLGAFQVALASDAHPQTWEMHPAGDEILVMLTGALDVEYARESGRGASSLVAGHGLVMPRGVWHRLDWREPGLLLTLTPLQGTLHGTAPEAGS